MTRTTDVSQLIAAARAQIKAARQSLDAGGELALKELERLTNEIAAQAATLPPDKAKQLEKPMLVLFEETDRLGTDIKQRHEELSRQLKGFSAGQRAAAAYGAKPGQG